MVSATWVSSKLTPYMAYLKFWAKVAMVMALVSVGWTANGWRLGKELAEMQAAGDRKEAARQTALTERQTKAMQDALGAVTAAQERLAAARRANAALVAKAAQQAPKGPQYACRDESLPEDYLEEFRQ